MQQYEKLYFDTRRRYSRQHNLYKNSDRLRAVANHFLLSLTQVNENFQHSFIV